MGQETTPKLSDPFDRAAFINAQLTQILQAVGKIDGKLDAFEGRLYRVEADGRVTRVLGIVSVALAVFAMALAVLALVLALTI